MTQGIDSSTPLTTAKAQAMAAAGYKFAARYLVPASYAWKRLTLTEANALTQAGLQIVSVYETSANRSQGGAAAGQTDGAAAYREACTLGQTLGSAIYFAVDYDAPKTDYASIEAYLKAAAQQIPGYQVGVYASYAVVEEMARRGASQHFWQTYAWSNGKRSSHAQIYQYKNGVSVSGITLDLNESYGSEGWWNTNKKEDPTMTADDANKIIKFLSAAWFAATTTEDKAEFNRLANEVRKAAGLPQQ